MAGVIAEDYEAGGGRAAALEGMSNDQRCQSGDSIAEWRSSEQVENGTPSTSPLYWDTDDDDDCGPKPSELFGKFTWKFENFSSANKRELRSNVFEIGGYKWYILIYPQGCDVCNHLSLFLCVANHDKLLPGWSHLAQFTIAVINKDIKKSKYSDTLHRFWKKEHDWGWKKFMELSKVYDGFIDADALIVKAQVQVIREKAHRPFRCLDFHYRRELIRVYLLSVEQTCRRFIEEKTGKLGKLIEDKIRWPSFRSFWLGTDPNSRRRMSRDKTDSILKVVVKNFFIEKEVASTLVIDSLYSGLKVLEFQSKKNGGTKLLELEKLPSPMVRVDQDMFVLADDILLLLERAVREPMPHLPLPPKDDKCLQIRTKDGSSGEGFMDSIERDERRLMELGRRTVEIFVLVHIFSTRIEVAYQEAVALMRQEELIREEEAASHAEIELRAKRSAYEKEKRSKKKQAKQKRNSRKGKDKGRNDNSDIVQEKLSQGSLSDVSILGDFIPKEIESVAEKINTPEDVSDVSDNGNAAEVLQPDLDDRDTSPVNWDSYTSEVILSTLVGGGDITDTQVEKHIQATLDDSSSTCSNDSVPSVVVNGTYKGSCSPNDKIHSTPNRGKNNQNRENHNIMAIQNSVSTRTDTLSDCGSFLDVAATKTSQPKSNAVKLSLKSEIQKIQTRLVEKEMEIASVQKDSIAKSQVDTEVLSKSKIRGSPSSSSTEKPNFVVRQEKNNSEPPNSVAFSLTSSSTEPSSAWGPMSTSLNILGSKLPPSESQLPSLSFTSKFESQKHNHPAKSPGTHQVSAVSRTSNAPPVAGQTPRPVALAVSTVQSVPLPSRSVSSAGRNEPSPSAPSYFPQSYRNAIIGRSATVSNATTFSHQTASPNQNIPYAHSSSTFMTSPPPTHSSVRTDHSSVTPLPALNSWLSSRDDGHPEAASSSGRYSLDLGTDIERLEIYGPGKHFPPEIVSKSVPYQPQGLFTDEFPHLDIINDLLDEESNSRVPKIFHHNVSRQYSFQQTNSLMDIGLFNVPGQFDHSEQYYEDVFQSAYVSSNSPLQGLHNGHLSQPDLSAYANNGHIEGVMQNQWLYGQHNELSYPNLGNGDTSRYNYQLPDYSGLLNGVNGINGYRYRPSSGP